MLNLACLGDIVITIPPGFAWNMTEADRSKSSGSAGEGMSVPGTARSWSI